MAKNQNNAAAATAVKKTEPDARKEALSTALAQIEKQFGKGAIMKLGDNAALQVEAISTGSLGLDLALGVGGVPRGRIIEIYGPESSARPPWRCTSWRKPRKRGARWPSSTWSTPWTPTTPPRWEWISTACWSASRHR